MAEPTDVPLQPRAGRFITLRSVALGTLLVAGTCALTPYNDYVVANTPMIGSFLPLALVISFFVLVVLVNAPLHRFAPKHALSSGELGVMMLMLLVAASVPATGLMRLFLPQLVAPFRVGSTDVRFWNAFTQMNLPGWLFPVESVADGRSSSTVWGFYGSLLPGESIPFAAWAKALAGWGVFFAGLFATILGLSGIVRRQWAVNERLQFPLAQLQLALIESPRPGRMLNDMLSRRSFWIALVAVLILQSLGALNRYFPREIPAIPLRYNLSGVMSEEPWVYFSSSVKQAAIYFTFIGIAYFIPLRISFSLWAFFLLQHVVNVQSQAVWQYQVPADAWRDQHLGSAVVYLAGIAWIGRHHWAMVLRQLVRRPRRGEPAGDFGSYRLMLVLAILGTVVMLGWLLFVGVAAWVAIGIVAFLVGAQVVTARVVAESGMAFIKTDTYFTQVYTMFPPSAVTGRDVFFSGVFTAAGPVASRECLMPFATHGLQVADGTDMPPRQRRGVMALMAYALLVAVGVSAVSSLWCYYHYSVPLTTQVQRPVLNPTGTEDRPRVDVVDPLNRHADGRWAPQTYNQPLNLGIGAAVTAVLQWGAWRFSAWPLAPVGYLVCSTYQMSHAWFSLLLGWLCKTLLVKYVGASGFQRAKPLFVGLIFGEALAAGLWLLITLILAWLGMEYQQIEFLPI
jgi:uncharacterized membrane protein (Fun14 family)